jgi:lipoate-protein ligase A
VRFRVSHRRGSAATFHALPIPDPVGPEVWAFEVERPAIALGSRQTADVLDATAVASAGIEVVHRRSGGGAVLLVPGAVTWLDVVVPAGHPTWRDDVGASMAVIGDAWASIVEPLGVGGVFEVHRGPMVRTPWSDLVCFDGLGPGEVTVDGAKLVGISQRRTRTAARFQCVAYVEHDPTVLPGLLAAPTPDAPLRPVATLPGAPPGDLAERLAAALA